MYVMTVGLNYRTTPIKIREKLAFSEEALETALEKLKQTKSVLEAVIVNTCNRTEIYAVVDQLHTGEHFIKKYLAEWFSISKDVLIPYLYVYKDIEATEHLFQVITGLDSMVLGETQILGQVRQAFMSAQKYNCTGTIFNTLFKQAISFAKKVHANTGIDENAVSVSYAAVELTKKIFDRLAKKNVLIIGAGEMSELTAIHLHSAGVEKVMVVNRTLEVAKALAEPFQGEAYHMDELAEALVKADIVISSTSSNTVIIDKPFMESVMTKRNNKTLFIIDIAVPRDIDGSVHELDNIYLYDIDDLKDIVDANLLERKRIAQQFNSWIDDEIYSFYQWVNTLGVIPLISALRDKSINIQEETMKSLQNKLPDLSEREVKIIRKHMKSIVNQMLKNPIMRVKEMSAEPDAEEMMNYFKKIFAIEDEEIISNPIYEDMKSRNKSKLHEVNQKRLLRLNSRL